MADDNGDGDDGNGGYDTEEIDKDSDEG